MSLLFIINEVGCLNYLQPYLLLLESKGIDHLVVIKQKVLKYAEVVGFTTKFMLPIDEKLKVFELINAGKFDACILSGCAEDIECEAIKSCSVSGITSYSIIDAWVNYKWRFTFADEVLFPDFILVPDTFAFNEATMEGLPAHKLLIAGHPALGKIMVSPGGPPTAIFLDQPDPRDWSVDHSHSSQKAWNLLFSYHGEEDTIFSRLIFCPHPDRPNFKPVNTQGTDVIPYSVLSPEDYRFVFGASSTAMVEAYFMGKLVFSLQPEKPERNFDPLSRQGKISLITSLEDLRISLQNSRSKVTISDQNPHKNSLLKIHSIVGGARYD